MAVLWDLVPIGRRRPPISETFPEIRVPWKAIAAETRDAIARDMIPGEPVPSALELARMYDVSRRAARKALAAVAAEGLIERVPGVRYRVPGVNRQPVPHVT